MEFAPCFVFIVLIIVSFVLGWVETRWGMGLVIGLSILTAIQATMPFFLMILGIFETKVLIIGAKNQEAEQDGSGNGG